MQLFGSGIGFPTPRPLREYIRKRAGPPRRLFELAGIAPVAAGQARPTARGSGAAFDRCIVRQHGAYRIPSEDTLIAFESAARLGSFSHAAEELGTTRTTVSRLVADLERQLSRRLLRRSRIGMAPTGAGKRLYDAVAAGLEINETAAVQADAPQVEDQVVVACSQAALRFLRDAAP